MTDDKELIARLRSMHWCVTTKANGVGVSDGAVAREAADRIEALTAKLATCEKYRDAYAECDRIGTQAVRDLEAKLAKAVEAFEVIRDRQYYRMGPGVTAQVIARATLAKIKVESHE
jgi:hypothetical protein